MTIKLHKGSVLLQTLIICLVLAYISINIVGWVFNRYTLSARGYNQAVYGGVVISDHNRTLSSYAFISTRTVTNTTKFTDKQTFQVSF